MWPHHELLLPLFADVVGKDDRPELALIIRILDIQVKDLNHLVKVTVVAIELASVEDHATESCMEGKDLDVHSEADQIVASRLEGGSSVDDFVWAIDLEGKGFAVLVEEGGFIAVLVHGTLRDDDVGGRAGAQSGHDGYDDVIAKMKEKRGGPSYIPSRASVRDRALRNLTAQIWQRLYFT